MGQMTAARLALVYEVGARAASDGGSMIEGCYLLRRAEAQRLQRSHLDLVLADIIPPAWRVSEAEVSRSRRRLFAGPKELRAVDGPDAMHGDGELASDSDHSAPHATTFGDVHAPRL